MELEPIPKNNIQRLFWKSIDDYLNRKEVGIVFQRWQRLAEMFKESKNLLVYKKVPSPGEISFNSDNYNDLRYRNNYK